MVFDHDGCVVAMDQRPHEQIYPAPGWVEHDPVEIWDRRGGVLAGARGAGATPPGALAAVGLANQREPVVVGARAPGAPPRNPFVWQDPRPREICPGRAAGAPAGIDRFRPAT